MDSHSRITSQLFVKSRIRTQQEDEYEEVSGLQVTGENLLYKEWLELKNDGLDPESKYLLYDISLAMASQKKINEDEDDRDV